MIFSTPTQNLDQIVSNLDKFDEFKFFADSVKLFNESHPQDLQQIVAVGLNSEK